MSGIERFHCKQEIPYSGKHEFCELQAIRENIIHECFVFVDKDRTIALIRENIIREMLYLVHSRKFSPVKISRYTVVSLVCSCLLVYSIKKIKLSNSDDNSLTVILTWWLTVKWLFFIILETLFSHKEKTVKA